MEGASYCKTKVKPRMRFGQYDTFAVLSLWEDFVDFRKTLLTELLEPCVNVRLNFRFLAYIFLPYLLVSAIWQRLVLRQCHVDGFSHFLSAQVSQPFSKNLILAKSVRCMSGRSLQLTLAAAIGEADIETSWSSFCQIERDILKNEETGVGNAITTDTRRSS